jgi:hypothetical protein
MKFSSEQSVTSSSLFLGVEVSRDAFAIHHDARHPETAERVKSNPLYAAFAVGENAPVLLILPVGGGTKIVDPVMSRDKVAMVDSLCGPFSVDVEPCETMAKVAMVVDRECPISIGHTRASYLAGSSCIPFWRHVAALAPAHLARLLIVIQDQANIICRQIGEHSHTPNMAHLHGSFNTEMAFA